MVDRALANLVLIVHLGFIVFVVLGGLLVLWRRWACLLHLPAAGWGVYVEVSGALCPLTPLENHFRRLAGLAGYPGGFVQHYLLPLVYPPGLTHGIQLLLALLVLLTNAGVYGFVARRWAGGAQPPAP